MGEVKATIVRDCVCPICDGDPVDRFCVCDGRGLVDRATADECAAMLGGGYEVRQLPPPPERMDAPCADCAYRGDSPEQERPEVMAVLRLAKPEQPFHCHQGMHLTASGRYVPLAEDAAGVPVGHPLCAGWKRALLHNERRATRVAVGAHGVVADAILQSPDPPSMFHEIGALLRRIEAGPDRPPRVGPQAPMFHEFDDTPFRVAADWTPPPRDAVYRGSYADLRTQQAVRALLPPPVDRHTDASDAGNTGVDGPRADSDGGPSEAVRAPAFANERGWKPARAHVSGKRVFYAPSPTPDRWWRMTARTPEEAERSATLGKPHDLAWEYLQSIMRPETEAEALEP